MIKPVKQNLIISMWEEKKPKRFSDLFTMYDFCYVLRISARGLSLSLTPPKHTETDR